MVEPGLPSASFLAAGSDPPNSRCESQALSGPVIAIAGPTASGKSSLAIRVAIEVGGGIVSADAMQVYRGMDIGTAKERGTTVDIAMVDVVDPSVEYSVALYQRAARAQIDAWLERGVTPIVCGGTGLYLDSIIDDLSFPEGGPVTAARRHWESIARRDGAAVLHDQLASRDPEAAALIHPNNVRRVVRALELSDQGISYAEQNRHLKARKPYYDAHVYAITMDRSHLRERICHRVDAMFCDGLVEEVESLAYLGLRDWRTASQAIGYKEVLDALNGTCTLDEARSLIKLRSCRYAKRQLSWLRRRRDVVWLDYETLTEEEAAAIIVEELREAGRAALDAGGVCHGTL